MSSNSNPVASAVVKRLAPPSAIGRVWLVGAGPGAADLLTLKALRTIEQADLIVYDNLVSEEIVQLFPKNTPALYVGKKKGHHSLSQSQINDLLLEKARLGMDVCRLKGGDGFIFGRGGEEMLYLRKHGVAVEVVPGITAASGCTSYAGIPLTHRGLAQGCTFVTAHAEKSLAVNWGALAAQGHTLVFYMGLSKASLISANLIRGGLVPDTPAAIIENGCQPNQRAVIGSLSQLESMVTEERLSSPSLIVVGDVVNLAEELDWYLEASIAQVAEHTEHQKLSA